MIKQDFYKVASQRHFFDKHDKVLIAVSGGLDSMTLLTLMLEYQAAFKIELGIAHVHHGQRLASDAEAAYLEEYAKKYGIAYHFSRFTGDFSEERARDFRYQFFKDCMAEKGYSAVVTAHHADDQAETVLMRLIRGSRLRHLSGIKERQAFGPGELIRPLLSFSKSEFESIFHFEDESNLSKDYFRNRVRHDYLPLLATENPNLNQHLYHLAQEVDDLTTAITHFIKEIDYTCLEVFNAYPDSIQSYFLQDYLDQIPDLKTLHKAQFEDLLHILRTQKNKIIPLKADYQLIVTYEGFKIEKINPKTDETTPIIMVESGNHVFHGSFQFGFNQKIDHADQEVVLLSESPVYLRSRQAGDQMIINGQTRKVRRLFIDQKVPLSERNEAIMIEQDQKILGIVGIAVSDLSKYPKSDTINNRLYIKKIK
ncbi:tRNA lysidine(34) synthetase TilS [Streptococcus moroccensis]|uniref:tRNA(Ile)-lysidine synthase n=1 Tax=Streptococcus moroccensis TaxID=1451356 RepID=A0ABT9YU23_9STRE|nr:tRNA lysidine(34) synthetase TilS [Streptococcus moroccensis]MDQ0223497.1 tRNA(Ile)-lysidine synthase [Streptococcus moroccensis]